MPINTSDRMRLGSNILIHFTNITRNADKILKEQKENNKVVYLKHIGDLVLNLESAL